MVPKVVSPLGEEHCDHLDACLNSCHQCEHILQMMRDAGFPAEAAEQQVAMHKSLATNLKRTFFPNRP